MNFLEVNVLTSVIVIGAYTLLLLSSFSRRQDQTQQAKWLLALLVMSIGWEFARYFTPELTIPSNIPLHVLLVDTWVLGVMTAIYAQWPKRTVWWILSSLLIGGSLVVNSLLATQTFILPNVDLPPITYGTLAGYTTWIVLNAYLLLRTRRDYKQTTFPWHANRLLFWLIALTLMITGELLVFLEQPLFLVAGHAIRFLGVLSIAYAIATYRIFDVRTRTQRGIAFVVITLVSASPLLGAILAVQYLTREASYTVWVVLTTAVVVLGIFLNIPLRQLVTRFLNRYLGGEGLATNQVVRSYSQATSRTLDVQQLSLIIVGTLNELLGTTRGALFLVTQTDDSFIIDPIPAMGNIPRNQTQFPKNHLFFATLAQNHQPILQYDLDFNPEFADLDEIDKAWLKRLEMEVFVPIRVGEEQQVEGFIAIGPKQSALPYQPSEIELMQILADQTTIALQNARLYSELGEQNERIQYLNVDLVNQNERLEIMDKVKSDFITIASHELRTPLTQVKGYSDILEAMNEENALTREQTREIVGHINRATLQLESLITAMLDASQLDVDAMQLTFVKTQLDTIIRLAIEPLAQAMRERRITLTVEGVDELPSIYADFKRLVQAFNNLIGNAVKYTPDQGQIHVSAKIAESTATAGKYVELVVSDTGIGIDPKYQELIFEKFFRIGDPQLHSTGSTKFKGAGPGLGLPIAKGVIEAHDGRIWVESRGENEEMMLGTAFHIILPLMPAGAAEKVKQEEEQKASRPAYLIG